MRLQYAHKFHEKAGNTLFQQKPRPRPVSLGKSILRENVWWKTDKGKIGVYDKQEASHQFGLRGMCVFVSSIPKTM